MSGCSCGVPKTVRVSDEGIYRGQHSGKDVRLRCCECGGKAGFLPLDALERLAPDIDISEISEPGHVETQLELNFEYNTQPYPEREQSVDEREHPDSPDSFIEP
jgi:hypothetical protein